MQTSTSTSFAPRATLAATATAATVARAASYAGPAPDELVSRIRSTDDSVRGPAWQGAAPYGAAAVKPLVAVMNDSDMEIARAAKRALWVIVRHAGRPGAQREARAVSTELIALLPAASTAERHELLWMISEISGDEAIAPVAALLKDTAVRADALAALARLPGRKSAAAIKAAFATAPEDFKFALADTLRRRGETVSGYASQKLVPSKQTSVTYQPPAAG